MFRRRKIRARWHQYLKQDCIARENGITTRLFKSSEVYQTDLAYWDYPSRSLTRSWKHKKRRKQWER